MRVFWLLAVALAVPALAGCGSSADVGGEIERDADGIPIAHVTTRYATALAEDVGTLAASVDVTFGAEVIGTDGQREVRIGEGTQQPLPLTVFLVRVDASAGEPAVGAIVRIEQLGGVTESAAPDVGKVRVVLKGDPPMEVGESYVFFARQDGPDTFSAAPFARFPVEDGRLTAPEGWEDTGASRDLAGRTPPEALAQ